MSHSDTTPSIKTQLNQETARIAWSGLQRFFASGHAIFVHASLDLIDVAAAIHADDASQVSSLMQGGQVGPVSDQQALAWLEQETEVWAVVVRPWVLVQDRSESSDGSP